MATQPRTIKLPEVIYSALEEAAAREHKSVEEIAGEAILRGLHNQKKSLLDELIEEGRQKAMEKLGHVPSEEEVVEIVHARREARRR
jgi:predicted CopG family antitoxin